MSVNDGRRGCCEIVSSLYLCLAGFREMVDKKVVVLILE